MLQVGDKVVYPMHGAGVIQGIEDCEIMGESKSYYVLMMPFGGMKVMIPMDNVEHVGLRGIIGLDEVDKVVKVLGMKPELTPGSSWNRRFNANLLKIKSGNIYDVAEVVRNLVQQDRLKKISTGERRLLDTAKQILVSELVLACDKDASAIEQWVYDSIDENASGD